MSTPPPSEPPFEPRIGTDEDYLDRQLIELRGFIDRYGFTKMVIGTGLCSVPGCDCGPSDFPFTYTVGLCEHGAPEFVSLGLSFAGANEVVDPICRAVIDAGLCSGVDLSIHGNDLPVGRDRLLELPSGRTAALLPVPDCWVDHDPGRIGNWFAVYPDRPVPTFLQICWSDHNGYMPWESECDPYVAAIQPILELDPYSYPEPPP